MRWRVRPCMVVYSLSETEEILIETLIAITLLSLLAITAIGIWRLHSLFAIVMLAGIYSLITATLFYVMHAVDVAFTEAAVGAGISTVLMLSTIALVSDKDHGSHQIKMLPLAVVLITGAALIYATLDMPYFGDPQAPANQHVAPRYIQTSPHEVGPPNMVTSVLASYRGYDTLGEVGVIFTAGVAVMLLLGSGARRNKP